MFQGNSDDGNDGGQGGFAYRDNFVRDESHLNDRVGATQMRAFTPDPGFGPVYLDVNPHTVYTWTVYNTMVAKALGIPQNRLRMLRQSHIDDFEVGVDYAYVVKGGEFKGKIITNMRGADLYDGRFALVYTYRGFFVLCRFLYTLPSYKKLEADVQQLIRNCNERAIPPRNETTMDPRLVDYMAQGKVIDVSASDTSQGDLFASTGETPEETESTPAEEPAEQVPLEDETIPVPPALESEPEEAPHERSGHVDEAVSELHTAAQPEEPEEPAQAPTPPQPPIPDRIPRLELEYRDGSGHVHLVMHFRGGKIVRWGAVVDREDKVNFFISCKGIKKFVPFSISHMQRTAKEMGLADDVRVYSPPSSRWGKRWMFSHVGLIDWCAEQIADMEKKRLVSPKSFQKLDRLRDFYAGLKETYAVYEAERLLRHPEEVEREEPQEEPPEEAKVETPPEATVEEPREEETVEPEDTQGAQDTQGTQGGPDERLDDEPPKIHVGDEFAGSVSFGTEEISIFVRRENTQIDWSVSTKQLAHFYGVGVEAIKHHKREKAKELKEGIHFFYESRGRGSFATSPSEVVDSEGKSTQGQNLRWTKKGALAMALFAQSKRAMAVRAYMVDLTLAVQAQMASESPEHVESGVLRDLLLEIKEQRLTQGQMIATNQEMLTGLFHFQSDYVAHKEETKERIDKTNERIDKTDKEVEDLKKEVSIFGSYMDASTEGPPDTHRTMPRSELTRDQIREQVQYLGYQNCLKHGGYKNMEVLKSGKEFRRAYREFYKGYAEYRDIKPNLWEAAKRAFGRTTSKGPLDWFEYRGVDVIFDACEYAHMVAMERRSGLI